MTLDPATLAVDLDRLEEVEKASLRLVVQAINDFRVDAADIFARESDLVQDIGEDITREAMDRMGTSAIIGRLSGKSDYKRARYVFHPDYSLRQALFVDSKVETAAAAGVARIQITQTSMSVRLPKSGVDIAVAGTLSPTVNVNGETLLTTTIFVKYNYQTNAVEEKQLASISLIALPNGMLQGRYNPTAADRIWNVGPDAPSLGEKFRARINLSMLSAKASWRVQRIAILPAPSHVWVP